MRNVIDIVTKAFKPTVSFFTIMYKTKLQFPLLIHFAGIAIAIVLFDAATNMNGFAAIMMILLALVVLIAFFMIGLRVWKKVKIELAPSDDSTTKKSDTDKKDYIKLYSPNPRGIVFGKDKGNYICKPEDMDGHVLVVGGVGTGKSSCIAIPTLRNWGESFFAIDIKGELHKQTEEYCDNIMVFNPLDESSYGYDPYFCLSTSENPAQDARAIAQAIIPLPIDTREPFWIKSAQNIFTAAILHYSLEGKNFLDTIRQIQKTPPKELIKKLSKSADHNARYYVNSLANMEEKTLSSVMTELSNSIVHFVTDKNLISALSREDNINPDYLELGNNIYINIPEHLLNQWETLLTLIVNQFLTRFQQRSEGFSDEKSEEESRPRPILFLLDEFPRLGKIDAILNGLATLRSKRINICLIIQSLAQLDDIYCETKRKIIADTCAFKAILGATDVDSQEYFSRLAGTHEKLITSHGTNRNALSPIDNSTSKNMQEVEKPLIKSQNFGMLDRIVLFTPFAMPYEKETSNPKRRKLAKLSTARYMRDLTHGLYVPLKERDPIAYQWKMKAKAFQEKSNTETKKASEKSEPFLDKHIFNIINEMSEDIYNCISPPTPVSNDNPDEILAPFGYVDKIPFYEENEAEINSKEKPTNGFAEHLTEKHVTKLCRQIPKLFMRKRKRIENAYMLDFLLKEDNLCCLQPNVFLRLITEINTMHNKYIKLYKKLYKVFFFSKLLKEATKKVLEDDFDGYFDNILESLNEIKDNYFVDKSD